MNKIDLHIHSTNSDGELSPNAIIQRALNNDVRLISITDHDIYYGHSYWKEILLNSNKIKLVPGVELSTDYFIDGEKVRIHLLAYDIKDVNNELGRELLRMKLARQEGNIEYFKGLKKSCDFIKDEMFADFDFSQYGRIVKLIMKHLSAKASLTPDQMKMVQNYFLTNKPKYNKCTLDIEQGIEIVKANGGVTSFAHPYQTKLSYDKLDKLVCYLKSIGLDAIEAYHGDATTSDNNVAIFLALKYELCKSAGSDFHDPADSHDIGCDVSSYPLFKQGEVLSDKFKKEKRLLSNEETLER